jgi:glycosyltransferase involved in cell wall biosynthesis
VVTPSYNQGEFVEETIRSVVSLQQDADVQYILIDAKSSDKTLHYINKYRDQIDSVVIEEDEGQADALKKGFDLADGEILGYLNSDDVYLPGALSWVCAYFTANPDVDVIYSHRLFIDKSGTVNNFWILPPHSNYCMMRWDYIPQETCFWRRSVTEKYGGIDKHFRFAMDYDLFARYMPHVRFRRVNKFLAKFRVHESSKTSLYNDSLGREEVERVREKYDIKIGKLDSQIERLWSYSILGLSAASRPWLLKRNRYLNFGPSSQ